jgi:adenosylcobinamide-phosphate synthase
MVPSLALRAGMLAAALLIDWLAGEYPTLLHPVVWLGWVISAGTRLAPRRGWWRQLLFGALLTSGTCALGVGATCLALHWAAVSPVAEVVVGIFFLKASFSLWGLKRAADGVVRPLRRGDLLQAREGLRSLCSRDPTSLGEEELLAGTIESLAENASDSFVAPLFYFILFGVPGAMGYRAVNTLDAMIGYRGRFEALGKVAARLDDLTNWIPARLTALLLLLGGWLTGAEIARGWRILRRDGAKTASPNAGRPMAAMAGLLGVQLEKKGAYLLGDPRRPLSVETVKQAWRIVAVAGLLMAALVAGGLGSLSYVNPR